MTLALQLTSFISTIKKPRWLALLALILVFLCLHFYLSIWVLQYVNRKINETKDYSGSIENIDLHLWRGAYVIRNITIYKNSGKIPVPFFSAPAIDLAVEWKALFHGHFVGNVMLKQPIINIVNGPTTEQTQTGVNTPWAETIKQLFPLKINRFHVEDGTLQYRDFYSHPKVDLKLTDLYITASNLTTSKQLSRGGLATLHAEGKPVMDGMLKADVTFDPYEKYPTFDLKADVSNIPLIHLSELTEAYAYFDFKKGTFAAALQLSASDGRFTGYVIPAFDHMQIFSLQQDIKNPVKLAWEGILGGVGRLFRNLPKDRFATKIPISGSFADPQEAILATIGNVFKNAFVRAFNPVVPGTIDVHDVRERETPRD